LIGDHLPILIGDQADWSLIGCGKTRPKSRRKILKICQKFSNQNFENLFHFFAHYV